MLQFETNVLCILEGSNAAICHASASHFKDLDSIQDQFLREIGLSEEETFLQYNTAPLKLRRDIGALGLLHKIQLGEAHPDFGNLLARKIGSFTAHTRHGSKRHNKQFNEEAGDNLYFKHSLFGFARVYNILPMHIVNTNSVSASQRLLKQEAKIRCSNGNGTLINLYCCRKLHS